MAATRENPLQPSAFIKVKFLGPDNKLWPVKGLLDSGQPELVPAELGVVPHQYNISNLNITLLRLPLCVWMCVLVSRLFLEDFKGVSDRYLK